MLLTAHTGSPTDVSITPLQTQSLPDVLMQALLPQVMPVMTMIRTYSEAMWLTRENVQVLTFTPTLLFPLAQAATKVATSQPTRIEMVD